jgi:hypothetical protein
LDGHGAVQCGEPTEGAFRSILPEEIRMLQRPVVGREARKSRTPAALVRICASELSSSSQAPEPTVGRCHTKLNLRSEVKKTRLELLLLSRLATSGALRLGLRCATVAVTMASCAAPLTPPSSSHSRASTICQCGERFGFFSKAWPLLKNGAADGGFEGMRRGVELLRQLSVLFFDGLAKMALAEAEARGGNVGEALATCEWAGYRTFEAELHRFRGEMLLKRDPASPALAKEAFHTAIAVAKRQATRSFELRAALSLAKLYQSTGAPPKPRPFSRLCSKASRRRRK